MGRASGAQQGDRTLSLTHRYLSWGLAHSLTQHSWDMFYFHHKGISSL